MKIDDFINIEKKYDLFNFEINGVNPWTYFRMGFWNFQICSQVLSLSDHVQPKRKKEYYWNCIKSLLFLMKRKNSEKVRPADILFVSHERRIKNGQNYECIYTDELTREYQNSIVLEKPYQGGHLLPVSIENIFYTDFLQWKASIYCRVHYLLKTRKYKKIYKNIERVFSEPIEELRETYKFTVSSNSIYRQLTKLAMEVNILKAEFEQILQIIKPKIIVEVVYYDKRCMVLNELAKENRILTIELQHGTMHSAHAAYQFPNGCGKIQQFPDYEFAFSEYWKRSVHIPIPEDNVKVTGYPYYERQLKQYKSKGNRKERTIILFISQGTIGSKLSMLASELCDLIDENIYHIIYKLHPSEYSGWKERTPWLMKDNIEVVDSLEHNIYEYFAKSSMQVGVYSTAIFEGLGFGLKTFIYNIGHADTMAALCEQGYASYVNNVQELFVNISGTNPNTVQDGKGFWKMNSFENICHEIDQLLACQRKEDRS